jgi:hypothetical protein
MKFLRKDTPSPADRAKDAQKLADEAEALTAVAIAKPPTPAATVGPDGQPDQAAHAATQEASNTAAQNHLNAAQAHANAAQAFAAIGDAPKAREHQKYADFHRGQLASGGAPQPVAPGKAPAGPPIAKKSLDFVENLEVLLKGSKHTLRDHTGKYVPKFRLYESKITASQVDP